MLEKRQKNKSTPQQLDFVESITQVDRLFTKRRLIAFVLSLSILSSLFFMVYGQILKGKKIPSFSLPQVNLKLPTHFLPSSLPSLPSLSLPNTISYTIKIQNLSANPPIWIYNSTSGSLDFDIPTNLSAKLSVPPPSSDLLTHLPTGLAIKDYSVSTPQTLSYFVDLDSPRYHVLLAFKFFGSSSELKSLSTRLPEFVELIYWFLVGQKGLGVGVDSMHLIRFS
ncbi:MAG: hypothetical protein WCT01_02790 [Candidatus Shapirobacteria bacterium]